MNTNIKWRTVESSFITEIGWLPLSRKLDGLGWTHIKIRDKTYIYLTPSWVYALLCSAHARGTSVGRVYSRVLRGAFPRVDNLDQQGGTT